MKKITTYEVGNSCPGLGQAQKGGGVTCIIYFSSNFEM
jgi:hypothetical protein